MAQNIFFPTPVLMVLLLYVGFPIPGQAASSRLEVTSLRRSMTLQSAGRSYQGSWVPRGMRKQGERLAVLVSGQTYRFVYRDMFKHFGSMKDYFGCAVDLYVALSSLQGPQWLDNNQTAPYASDVLDDPEAVASFLKKYGFEHVNITVLTPEQVVAARDQLQQDIIAEGGGQAWFASRKIDTIGHQMEDEWSDERYESNREMLYLRSKVYSIAKSSESNYNYRYSGFMYLREDDVFHKTPQADFAQIAADDMPSVAVGNGCPFRGVCDKFYFGNRQGLDVLFGKDYHGLLSNLVHWLNGKDMATESATLQLMLRNGVKIVPVDFGCNCAHYQHVSSTLFKELCIQRQYAHCSAAQNVISLCPWSVHNDNRWVER